MRAAQYMLSDIGEQSRSFSQHRLMLMGEALHSLGSLVESWVVSISLAMDITHGRRRRVSCKKMPPLLLMVALMGDNL